MTSGVPDGSAFERWARVTAPARLGLRRGAWYPVLSVSPDEAVIEVNHRPTIVPRPFVEITQSRATRWAVVRRSSGAPYLVCPACAERVQLPSEETADVRCPRCGGSFAVEFTFAAAGTGTERSRIESGSSPDGTPINILLIEDREDDIALTLRALERAKIQNRIWIARDGVPALSMLRSQFASSEMARPDLVLLDLNLPQLDGRDVLLRIREDPTLRGLPVVVLTSSDAEHERLATLAADAFLTKPVDFERLGKVVRAITGLGWAIVRVK